MAAQPKKKKTTTTPKKKTTVKRKTTAKKHAPRRKKKTSNSMKKNILIVLGVFFMISFVVLGYYLGKYSDTHTEKIERGEVESAYTTKKLLEDLSKIKTHKKETKTNPLPQKKAKPKKIKPKNPVVVKKEKLPPLVVPPSVKKARLVIIIDDISKQSQINAMQATGLRLTPSIFPPSELSMTSNHLADGLEHCMIHLPMESGSKQFNSQYKTLLTSFSKEKIEHRVEKLRQLFPKVRYVNNHTGSVFTQDKTAMTRLYEALRRKHFRFVDSRTIGSSKVAHIAHTFGDTYVSRDIFIDNHHTIAYIHKQLREAVGIAKKKGYAIAIGHPHKVTMKALTLGKDILKDVELVYIDSIYKKE